MKKHNIYSNIHSINTENVYHNDIQDANDANILVRLPSWVKSELLKRENTNRYIRDLILADFSKCGIRRPFTEQEKEQMRNEGWNVL
jgi:hypothetical protein